MKYDHEKEEIGPNIVREHLEIMVSTLSLLEDCLKD